jgi:hypothetical protein
MDRQRGIMATVRRFDAFLFYQALDGCVNRSRTYAAGELLGGSVRLHRVITDKASTRRGRGRVVHAYMERSFLVHGLKLIGF